LTSLARRHLPRRWWRWIHHLSVPAFAISSAHLWLAGADATNPVVLVASGALCGAIVMLLAAWASLALTRARAGRPLDGERTGEP
jgi:DMSO/TMAO reductase YedYZ heme-binding membrane subunit